MFPEYLSACVFSVIYISIRTPAPLEDKSDIYSSFLPAGGARDGDAAARARVRARDGAAAGWPAAASRGVDGDSELADTL